MKLPSFDEMKKLAETDPDKLEQIKMQVINDTIEKAPECSRARLRSLQWRVDKIVERASNPLHACIQISKMMHDNLTLLRGTILGGSVSAERSDDNVVQFGKRKEN